MSEITITEMFKSGKLKDIPGYEGLYAVSVNGQIWSYPKKGNRYCAKWLKALLSKNVKGRIKPYYTSRIMLVKDGITKTLRISRLVALTYLPNSQNLPQINHKDGNTSNNHVDNLEWASASSNMSHAVENRLFDIHSGAQDITRSNNGKKTGALNGMKSRRRFSISEANCIRQIYEVGRKSYRAIARAYRCSDKTISNICKGRTYLIEMPEIVARNTVVVRP